MRKQKIDMMSILQENEAIIDGHFELPNGLHIQSYIDTDVLFQYPGLTTKIAQALADLFDSQSISTNSILTPRSSATLRPRSASNPIHSPASDL